MPWTPIAAAKSTLGAPLSHGLFGPHHKERFSRCHARYFAEKPRAEWSGTLVVDAFVNKPEALRLVRDQLLDHYPAIWNAVCADVLTACSKFPTADEQVIETRRICGIEAA
jgi:hypothetical protein